MPDQLRHDRLARLFLQVVIGHMRGIFGHHQTLAQIRGIKPHRMIKRRVAERLLQNIQRPPPHHAGIEHLARQRGPLAAKALGLQPQHAGCRGRSLGNRIQRHVESGGHQKRLDPRPIRRPERQSQGENKEQ